MCLLKLIAKKLYTKRNDSCKSNALPVPVYHTPGLVTFLRLQNLYDTKRNNPEKNANTVMPFVSQQAKFINENGYNFVNNLLRVMPLTNSSAVSLYASILSFN